MQELKREDAQGKITSEQYPIPEDVPGITIAVKRNLKKKVVVLEIGNKSVGLTIQGARDLALALRMNANFVEKNQ